MQAEIRQLNGSDGSGGDGSMPYFIQAVLTEQHNLRLAIELQNKRIEQLEKSLAEHNKTCAESKRDIEELLDLVTTVKQGMKLTNFLRNAFVGIAGVIAAAMALWHQFKG